MLLHIPWVCSPVPTHHTVGEAERYLVFGSDGLFEFLNNETVVKMVEKWKEDLETGAQELVRIARAKWVCEK